MLDRDPGYYLFVISVLAPVRSIYYTLTIHYGGCDVN